MRCTRGRWMITSRAPSAPRWYCPLENTRTRPRNTPAKGSKQARAPCKHMGTRLNTPQANRRSEMKRSKSISSLQAKAGKVGHTRMHTYTHTHTRTHAHALAAQHCQSPAHTRVGVWARQEWSTAWASSSSGSMANRLWAQRGQTHAPMLIPIYHERVFVHARTRPDRQGTRSPGRRRRA